MTKGSEQARLHSIRMMNNKFASGEHSNKGRKMFYTDEHKNNIRKHLKNNVNSKGLNIDNGARCKFYEIAGLRCQGKWELAYINSLIKNDKPLPTKAKTITTPFGFYTPDFEFEEKFIDVKSTYTLKTCIKSKQKKKIDWVSNNVKKVKLVVLKESFVKDNLPQL
jgi:hypothetical protein